jgi:Transposase
MTEKHTESGTKLITGHKRDGRCIYSKQGKGELAQACSRPGVCVAGMALRYGVNANLLRKWIRVYQEGGQQVAHGAILEARYPAPVTGNPGRTDRFDQAAFFKLSAQYAFHCRFARFSRKASMCSALSACHQAPGRFKRCWTM